MNVILLLAGGYATLAMESDKVDTDKSSYEAQGQLQYQADMVMLPKQLTSLTTQIER